MGPSTFTLTVTNGKLEITASVTDQPTIDALIPVLTAIKPLLSPTPLPPPTPPTP